MKTAIIFRGLANLALGAFGLSLLLGALNAGTALSVNAGHAKDGSFWEVVILFVLLLAVGTGFVAASIRQIRTCLGDWERSSRRYVASVEDRLEELDRLKRRDMVTAEEYAAKRQEILKDL